MNYLFAFFFSLLFFSFSALQSAPTATFKERLKTAKQGDYIVTAQGGHYSLLMISRLSEEELVLEEVTAPGQALDLKKIRWKQWLTKKAPGHTAWVAYTFDLRNNRLKECISPLQRQKLYLEEEQSLFTKLLGLSLTPTPEKERKRIGPAPVEGELDRRKLWIPPLFRGGKKLTSPQFEVVQTVWPKDKSRLSECILELYFSSDFPFPYMLEVQSSAYGFKLQAVDSGNLYEQL